MLSPQTNIFVISAPSGTGKTTLNRRLILEHPELEISVSLTTRNPRPKEKNGVDYIFISETEFMENVSQNKMLEWANVFGNLYGTRISEIERIQEKDHSVLLEIDVQGWLQAHPKLKEACAIFILPPSIKTLWERLCLRKTESKEVLLRRLNSSTRELSHPDIYDFYIINDDVNIAYEELKKIIVEKKPGKISIKEGKKLRLKLLDELHAFLKNHSS